MNSSLFPRTMNKIGNFRERKKCLLGKAKITVLLENLSSAEVCRVQECLSMPRVEFAIFRLRSVRL